MSREVCGICWCPYDEITGECACVPSTQPCSNCASLEAQNTELDRKLAEMEQPVQEPVAWRHKGAGHFTVTPLVSKFPEWEPLYTAPPQRQPLTEDEIDASTAQERDALLDHIYEYGTAAEGVLERIRKLCRATEQAHGIGEQP